MAPLPVPVCQESPPAAPLPSHSIPVLYHPSSMTSQNFSMRMTSLENVLYAWATTSWPKMQRLELDQPSCMELRPAAAMRQRAGACAALGAGSPRLRRACLRCGREVAQRLEVRVEIMWL